MLEEVIAKLKSKSCAELRAMAVEINVSFDTLFSIRIGRIKDPKISTVTAILNYQSWKI